ncbi:sn-glycerol 3-phosphate transport system permease [Enterococcus sp. AZ194]
MINTYLGMMVIFFVTALNIFVMRQHFLAYSKSIYEAAKMDGCSNFEFFIRVLLPSSKPVLITTFISSFVGVWNQYLWPLLVTNQNEMRTAQVAVTLLNFPDESPHGGLNINCNTNCCRIYHLPTLYQKRYDGWRSERIEGRK